MKKSLLSYSRFISVWIAAILFIAPQSDLFAQNSKSLAGQWKLKIDHNDVGIQQQWFDDRFSDFQNMLLPGSIQEYDFGEELSIETEWLATNYRQFFELEKYAPYRTDDNFKFPFWLTSKTHYKGVTWFQREIEIPENWLNKRVTLELERSHWGSMVFVNNQKIGADSSLATPHRYDLSEALSPGVHTLTVRVDNRLLVDVGQNSHSITDHTQTNWNGLVGDLLLKASDPVYISDVQVYPDVENNQARVQVHINNKTGERQSGTIQLQASSVNTDIEQVLPPAQKSFSVSESGVVELTYSMGDEPLLWDEFNPHFYAMNVELESGSTYSDLHTTNFGMRNFTVNGTRFHINDRPVFLRGTLESAIFPKTGYPSTSKKEWAHILNVAKQHGLNHIRFHSWCPPKAAFEAADEAGIYFQVEASAWVSHGPTLGDGKPVDQFVIDESKRIMQEYGNHPSFVMFSHGNEPAGDHMVAYLTDFVNMWKKKDNRRLYTGGSAWPVIDANEFHVIHDPRIHHGWQELNSIVNAKPPSTDWNFADDLEPYDLPVVGHEIGQWTVYPNFNEMSKYTGVLYPHNFEIFQDFLEQNHMLHQAHDFMMASGKLQALLYRSEIEAALRTPNYAGFQMLDIRDFPGQGTALVGILDPFWDSKPYINSEEFSRFSASTVPLAIMSKRILSNTETFTADLEIAHFAEHEEQDVPVEWKITNSANQILATGKTKTDLPIDNNIKAGRASLNLASFDEPQKLNLQVTVGTLGKNDWDFWVYPETVDTDHPADLIITKTLTPAIERKLKEGAMVLLKLNGMLKEGKGKEVAAGFSTIFWNTAWTGGQAPHTMGLLVDPSDALFNSFPTEYHTNWQWWDIVHNVHPMVLNDFPAELTPTIQMIDDWFDAKKLGLLFEAKVGKGKLVVTSIDFENDLDEKLASRQLYHSLLEYMEGEHFDPKTEIEIELVQSLYN